MVQKPTYEELEQKVRDLAQREFEHKKTEEALRQSDERHWTVLRTAMDGFWMLDIQEHLLEVNETYCRMSGYSAQELLTMRISDLEAVGMSDDTANRIRKVITQGEDRFESRQRRKNGTIFDVEISVQYWRTEGGRFVCFLRDITERKSAEDELLRMSEENFSTLADNAYDGIMITTADGRHIYANQRAAEITGYSITELMEVNLRQLVNPGEIYMWEDKLKKRISGKGFTNQYQTEIFTKGGTPVPVEITSSRTIWHGQAADMLIIRDITERKRTEEALRESEKKLRSLVETTSDWVWEIDLNGVYTYTSPKVKDIIGYDADEIIGTVYSDYMEGKGIKLGVASFHKKNEPHKPFINRQVKQFSKDGRPVILEVNGTPIFDSNGNISGWIGFNRDITDKVRAKTALKQKEKDLEAKANDLQEVNAALKVLLRQREEDRTELEVKVVANIKQLVEPYLDQLKKTGLKPAQETYLNIIQSNLQDVISPFVTKLSSRYSNLTPAEIKVMNLIKQGKSTKEIAELLSLSWQTIEFQRKHIRKKIGINNKKTNLRTHLLHVLSG